MSLQTGGITMKKAVIYTRGHNEEMQEILCIGKNTAYKLLINQEVKAFKIGRLWKIPKSSVQEYIQRSVSGR